MDELEDSFHIPDSARDQHVYIAGKTRHGKSNLIFYMAYQDIKEGKGVCVIDPHGSLVRKLIHYIPENRVEKTIYLDFTQAIPLDFFNATNDKERDYLADDILITFRRLDPNWGIRMDSLLRNTLVALLLVPGTTFLDIYRMITDSRFRQSTIDKCGNPTVQDYFINDFPDERKDSKLAITTRMTKFLLTPALKTIVGHPEPRLKIPDLMENQNVLLVNLNEVGEETGSILGSLLVSK